ncbi:unnamed protein product, partial [Ilex paraguariensis]
MREIQRGADRVTETTRRPQSLTDRRPLSLTVREPTPRSTWSDRRTKTTEEYSHTKTEEEDEDPISFDLQE